LGHPVLAGLRLESIEANYTGTEVRYLEDGDYDQTLPLRGGKDDSLLLPSLHIKHSFSASHQLRGALTRSYARANVYDQVPYQLVLEEDLEIVRGNPEIELTTVWNADLSWESYLSETDLFSVGVFYKDMEDYIYIMQTEQEIDGATYQVTQPLNGPEAKLYGIELSLQKTFSLLPGWWSGFGLFFNATYTRSKAQLEGRRDFQLPGQAEKTANLALLYEKAGFSLRLSTNLHDEFSEALGEEEADDIYVDRHLQWDAFASYQMKRFKLFLELINLNDEPFLRYQGDASHPLQYESYQAWGRLGLKYEF
jgi:TonB-dependent receptor